MPLSLNGAIPLSQDISGAPYYWFELNVTGTIRGTLVCDSGPREAAVTLDFTVLMPVRPIELVFGGIAKGLKLKATWWSLKAPAIYSAMRNHADVMAIVKQLVDSSEDICKGNDAVVRQRRRIDQPLWLDQDHKPMPGPPSLRQETYLRHMPRTSFG
jgi:hypothetical protein